jgi:hypothetical protein
LGVKPENFFSEVVANDDRDDEQAATLDATGTE